MCGLAGFVTNSPSEIPQPWLDSTLQLLAHRGPDDLGWLAFGSSGVHRGRSCFIPPGVSTVLLHRRLSILDLSPSGWQPMSSPDGQAHLVFNGEIYNYLELREELSRLGCVFHSQSDTEVLLHALQQWGSAALQRLVGMFALALLDIRRRTLFLARDFFGIKPLYYTHSRQVFAFSSEIKSLLDLPIVSRRVNAQRLYEYLRLGRTDHGTQTLLADVRQLPAGCYLEISLDARSIPDPVRYWSLDVTSPLELSLDEASRRLRELFLDSIRLHLRSDVPVGAALSGGIDSSAIVAAMREVAPHADLHAFSYVADDPQLSEEHWIDLAGTRAKAVIHKVRATPDDLVSDLNSLIHSQDEPFGSTSIYAQYRVFRAAREAGVKVMLDGQGADELLGGYRSHLAARLLSLIRTGKWREAIHFARRATRLPGNGNLIRLLLQMGTLMFPPPCKRLAHWLLGDRMLPAWLNPSWFSERGVQIPSFQIFGQDALRDRLVAEVETTSLPMLLRYEDRNSMASSVESRVPFLTPSLASFLLRLPEKFLISPDGTSKSVFRLAMRGLVPDAILDRRDKIGFATPERHWLTTLRPWVEATLNSEYAQTITPLSVSGVRAEWRQVLEGRKPFDFRVWRWVNLIRWSERVGVHF